MSAETAFIDSLRALATDPAARGLLDDAAVLEIGAETLVLTHDMIAEGIHYLPDDPPADVGLEARGGEPVRSCRKGRSADRRLARLHLGRASMGSRLRGRAWPGARRLRPAAARRRHGRASCRRPRVLGLTAIGWAGPVVPSRAGARPGDRLWVSGSIGDAGAGLRQLRAGKAEPAALIERYRNPRPRLEAGQRLAGLVSAMMDVSDGLLIDAARLACGERLRGGDRARPAAALAGLAGAGRRPADRRFGRRRLRAAVRRGARTNRRDRGAGGRARPAFLPDRHLRARRRPRATQWRRARPAPGETGLRARLKRAPNPPKGRATAARLAGATSAQPILLRGRS